MRKICFSCLLSCLVLLTGCGGREKQEDAPSVVRTAEAVGVGDAAELCYPGKTKSAEDVNVAFRVSGTIERVLAKEGQYVRKGQLLAVMDSRDYRVQLHATEAEYAQVKADAERVMAMYEEQGVSASDYDRARYGLRQITEKLANHRNQLADTRLVAPRSGYVQRRLHEAGETVSAGMPVVTLLSAEGIEVEVFIPASDYARRDMLLDATCSFAVIPDKVFPLEVARVSPDANASQLYMARLRLKGDYDRSKITPGMTTMVYATYRDTVGSSHVKVPTSAVYTDDGQTFVYVLSGEAEKVVSRRVVKAARLDSRGNTEIVDGLKAGERVVTAGVRRLHDGQRVREAGETSDANVGKLL